MSSKKKQDGSDERFLRVQKDPRFWEMPEKEHKIKIDKRFQSMFHDNRFKVKQTVDKRGRPINHSSTEDLKRFYKLSESEEDEEQDAESEEVAEDQKKKKVKKTEGAVQDGKGEVPKRGVRVFEEDDDDDDDDDDDNQGDTESSEEEDEEEDEDSSSDSGPDLARGKGNVETSSDEDEDDEDDVDAILRREEEEIQHDWGELCKDAQRSEEVWTRLAVCNMDWDRMKAKDLLALFSSFTPKGGAVLSVKIYPSEFGKERLKAEETQGPPELKTLPEDSEDDTEEERVYREKMRDYQFKRLKYFYAVVECDSVNTASRIYEECDGYEYESSCSVLDLCFIPDHVKFDEEPKDVATDVNLTAYTPKLFSSSAAATSKVQLTWDETDHDRVTAMNRKFNKDELMDMDFNAYLASSSESEEEQEEEQHGQHVSRAEDEEKKKKKNSEEQISKYRELLKGLQDKEKRLQEDRDMEMEISWVPGLKETTEQLVKKKLDGKDKLTPWDEFLQRKKERKKQKKSERKQRAADDLSDDELPPDVDLSDPFFSEELGPAGLKKKKKRKMKQEEEERTVEEEEELQKQKAEMALLMEDDADEVNHKHFNYDKIVEQQNLSKKKKKKLLKKGGQPQEDDGFQVDVKDPRFQAMFTSHLFNLDPSHPNYRKTKATQSILAEKQRRRQEGEDNVEEQQHAQKDTPLTTHPANQHEAAERSREEECSAPTDPSLSLLVKSIKNKTQQFQARKKQRVV